MFRKIIVPTDGSDYALTAAQYAADVAARYEASLDLIHVAELPPVLGIQPSEESQDRLRQELTERGKEALARTREVIQAAGVEPHEELVIGSAVPDILRHTRDGQYDLLVMGARGAGTGAIDQILIGSVAEGILHGARCPILMIRAKVETTA